MTLRAAAGTVALVAASVGAALLPGPVHAAEPSRPAVVERRVIGHSVKGVPIRAWRVGDPRARTKAVALATLHGDESAPGQILQALRDGRRVRGIDLWVIPVVNPDGLRRGTRRNANGVDLNRNFPRAWTRRVAGSGPRPASEPETRAVMRFVRRVDPRFVVSFHQPLHGVDTWQAKRPWFVRRLAEHLRLPRKSFPCGGTCHGTFTQWFNHGLAGAAVTVEYGRHPSGERLHLRAPGQLLRALGGRY